jgi:hypothetical protein
VSSNVLNLVDTIQKSLSQIKVDDSLEVRSRRRLLTLPHCSSDRCVSRLVLLVVRLVTRF